MTPPDDSLQRIAQALAGEDGCCCLWDADGRCCMTARARDVLAAVLPEIELQAFTAGLVSADATLEVFARRYDVDYAPRDIPALARDAALDRL